MFWPIIYKTTVSFAAGHTSKVFHVRWSPLREGILCSGSDDGYIESYVDAHLILGSFTLTIFNVAKTTFLLIQYVESYDSLVVRRFSYIISQLATSKNCFSYS